MFAVNFSRGQGRLCSRDPYPPSRGRGARFFIANEGYLHPTGVTQNFSNVGDRSCQEVGAEDPMEIGGSGDSRPRRIDGNDGYDGL